MTATTTTVCRASASLLCVCMACGKPVPPSSEPVSHEADASSGTASAFSGRTLAERASGPVPELGTPGIPWTEKTPKQRLDFMGAVFFPDMRKRFEGHSAQRFRGFRCQTCHGPDMKERNYAMPSSAVFPLDPERPYEDALAYDPEVTRFMAEDVVPAAAKLLGTRPYDPTTGEGLGCPACHPPG